MIEPNEHAEIHDDHTRALFQIKTWPDPDQDNEIENSVEAWGSFQTYWKTDMWAEKPPNQVQGIVDGSDHGKFRALETWPVSEARTNEIEAAWESTGTSLSVIRAPEDRNDGDGFGEFPAFRDDGHLTHGHYRFFLGKYGCLERAHQAS